ncbi:MAG: hypothetical protein JRN59_05035 [Nitrososphaerota archaeon]|jgi:predicted transcriptional regulator|nr:hypothetical protein [Nitrososphaerota archaeon]MDG6920874.1 hypothetical protein [Nitrososphaerota archaeon]MDG6949451.1 hypothetical protein [Nitrososphaerota archaeon]
MAAVHKGTRDFRKLLDEMVRKGLVIEKGRGVEATPKGKKYLKLYDEIATLLE